LYEGESRTISSLSSLAASFTNTSRAGLRAASKIAACEISFFAISVGTLPFLNPLSCRLDASLLKASVCSFVHVFESAETVINSSAVSLFNFLAMLASLCANKL